MSVNKYLLLFYLGVCNVHFKIICLEYGYILLDSMKPKYLNDIIL